MQFQRQIRRCIVQIVTECLEANIEGEFSRLLPGLKWILSRIENVSIRGKKVTTGEREKQIENKIDRNIEYEKRIEMNTKISPIKK